MALNFNMEGQHQPNSTRLIQSAVPHTIPSHRVGTCGAGGVNLRRIVTPVLRDL
jgi:hypothetical protein